MIRRQVPTWDLYLITENGTKQIVRNAEEKQFLDKYFIGLKANLEKYPEITSDKLISAYKNIWSKKGELRSFYTDSWGHKWVCFPKDDKLIKYLKQYVKT